MRKQFISAFFAVGLSGCATTFADEMRERGAQFESVANQWERGQELIEDGEEMVERGRAMIRDGERMQANAERTGAALTP